MIVSPSLFIPVSFILVSLALINQLAILSSIAIAGGLYFLFLGSRLHARKRSLAHTPRCKIGNALQGLVEVNGAATGPYNMPSPITGKACFLYRTTVWQQRDGRGPEWEKVADESLHLPFFIDDSTGRLLVEPLGADLDLHTGFREEYDAAFFSTDVDRIPPRVSVFLSRHGIVPTGRLRIEERLIEPEDALFVAGTLMQNPGVQVRPFSLHGETPTNGAGRDSTYSPGARDSLNHTPDSEIIRLQSDSAPSTSYEMSQQAKIAAALTRAGIAKPEAWSAAGLPSRTSYKSVAVEENPATPQPEARPNRDHASSFDLAPPVVIMKDANDAMFTISFRSQKESVGALAWKSAATLCGGAAITLLGLYTLLRQMELL